MSGFGESLGSAAMAGVSGGLTSGISGLITAPLSFGLNQISAAQQYKRQKKLMSQQHQYELENLAAQDKYQRALQVDSASMLKESLRNAGYSTADPNGSGVTPAAVSGPSTSASGSAGEFAASLGDGASSFSALQAGELSRSQAELNRIEAKVRERKLNSEIAKNEIEAESMRQKLPQEVDILKQEVRNKAQDWNLNEKKIQEIDANIERLSAVAQGVKIDNRYKPWMLEGEVTKLQRECDVLLQEGRYKAVEAKLAEFGILVGADWFSTCAAIASQGKGDELTNAMAHMISTVMQSLPSAAGTLVDGLSRTAAAAGSKIGGALGRLVSGK